MSGGLLIIRVARRAKNAERMAQDALASSAYIRDNPALRLFQLTEDLDAWGETNGNGYASCNPCRWNPIDEEWGVDTSVTLTMVETLGLYYGLSGEKLWGSIGALGTNNATIVHARSHGAPTHQGKLDGALAANGTATFSLWTKASGSWADTTVNVTVNAPPRLESGSIAANRFGRIHYELTAPGWEYDSGPCP